MAQFRRDHKIVCLLPYSQKYFYLKKRPMIVIRKGVSLHLYSFVSVFSWYLEQAGSTTKCFPLCERAQVRAKLTSLKARSTPWDCRLNGHKYKVWLTKNYKCLSKIPIKVYILFSVTRSWFLEQHCCWVLFKANLGGTLAPYIYISKLDKSLYR